MREGTASGEVERTRSAESPKEFDPPAEPQARRLRSLSGSRLGKVSPEAAVAALAGLLFIVGSVVWASRNVRVPDFDSAKHMTLAFIYYDAFGSGAILDPFRDLHDYPPLLHLVGALGAAVGGKNLTAPLLAQVFVFVPMFVAGLYGAGKSVYNRQAGMLAVLFGLGCPMIIGQFHVFMLEAPLAGVTALAVWLLLASEDFEKPGYSVMAGVAVALGFLTKQVFPLFVMGLMAVMLIRGGWRQWRNLLLFAAPVLVLAAPWYVANLSDVAVQTNGATAGGAAGSNYILPARWSVNNAMWYVWNLINVQVLVPLLLFFFVGVVTSVRGLMRGAPWSGRAAGLLAGVAVGYLAMTYIVLKDARYTLPLIVYVAVLGTGWITSLKYRAKIVAVSALVAIALVNTAAVNLALGQPVRLSLKYAKDGGVYDRSFTLYTPSGYGSSEPRRDDVLTVMKAARRDGFRRIDFDTVGDSPAFHVFGLTMLARFAGLEPPREYNPSALGPHDLFAVRRAGVPGEGPPCTMSADDPPQPIYFVEGNPLAPRPQDVYCPIRSHEVEQRYGQALIQPPGRPGK